MADAAGRPRGDNPGRDRRQRSGTGRSGGGQSRSERSQSGRPEAGRTQPGRSTSGRPQTGRAEGGRPRSGRPGNGRAPASRPRTTDAARRAAFDVLRAVDESGSYANLVLPPLLTERGIRGRDAAFATELAYGTLRMRGRYDAIIARTSNRPVADLDAPILDVLRLGLHQLLAMRVPTHAAVAETVALARSTCGAGPAQLVNAVLRAAAERDVDSWLEELRAGPDPLTTEYSHPAWVVRALREALVGNGRPATELADLLAADNLAPEVTLAARPGLVAVTDLRRQADHAHLDVTEDGRWAPTALRLAGGDPASLPAIRSGLAGVQDEGSQLVTLAAASAVGALPAPAAAIEGPWLDMCAGPGGKAALLGAVLAGAGQGRARLVASDLTPHRADLVRRSVRALTAATDEGGGIEVRTGDGRDIGRDEPGRYALTLLDAPCTGLGALRRRPEARWRRTPGDVGQLAALQRDLLESALDATAPGGVVAYVTCSPHLAETHAVVGDAARHHRLEVLDAVVAVQAAARAPVPGLGAGPYVQLWPHLHGTDAMFLALLRVPAAP
jgi:16S rRNA (cytosine967-C5)-methyltransferase